MAQNQEPQFNRTSTTSDNGAGRNVNWNLAGSNVSLNNQAQSTSRTDIINNNNNNTNKRDNERLRAYLPGYRLAPDYETAIMLQRKYRQNELHHVQQTSRVASDPHINIYSSSHPDVHRATAIADAMFGQQLQQRSDVAPNINSAYRHQFDPNASLAQQMQMMRIHKYAQPYRFSSTSTPDLALGSNYPVSQRAYVSGSSPDLVSTRMFANLTSQPPNTFRGRYSQNYIPHGSYEKIIFPDAKPNFLSQKSYEGSYRVPNQQQGFVGSYSQLSGSRASIDPIYENQIDDRVRPRASSIQLSNGMPLFKQQHQRQPLHTTSTRNQLDPVTVLPNSHSLESIYRPVRNAVERIPLNQRHVQFEALNRSQSVNVLDSTTESGAASSDQNNSKEKKKRRWKFWGNKGKNSLSEKSKSESSGWYKNKSNKYSPTKEEEINARNRWSAGLSRLPLPTTMSKETLVRPKLLISVIVVSTSKFWFNYSAKYWKQNWLIRSCTSSSSVYQNVRPMPTTVVHCSRKIV